MYLYASQIRFAMVSFLDEEFSHDIPQSPSFGDGRKVIFRSILNHNSIMRILKKKRYRIGKKRGEIQGKK